MRGGTHLEYALILVLTGFLVTCCSLAAEDQLVRAHVLPESPR